jgi:UDP-N-acetyl-D-glucosamine dehydrogenase
MNKTHVCIVGLGYVGLPLACLCAEKGFKVTGFDIDNRIIGNLRQGITIIDDLELKEKVMHLKNSVTYSVDPVVIKEADIVIVCVPTPVTEDHLPNLKPLEGAIETVKSNIKQGALVIIESTIFPGTTEEVILPLFSSSNFNVGVDFYLAHCPERIDPGNKKWNVGNIPRVVGGITEECANKAFEFYNQIIDNDVLKVNSVKAAEATKVMENSFRDINIAFMNELAMSFEKMGIDITEVIKAASTKPFSFMPHWPGCGVGGHCIPVDPYYLIEKAKQSGFEHKFLKLARQINNSMPTYTITKVSDVLNKLNFNPVDATITVLGVAYKPNVNDTRESPAFMIIEELRSLGVKLKIYDPFVPEQSNVSSFEDALTCDCLVLVTSHQQFNNIVPELLRSKGVKAIVDGRNFFNKEDILKQGILYKGIGK